MIPKRIRVVKYIEPLYWYAGRIGDEFDVVSDMGTDWEVPSENGETSIWCIKKEDAEPIHDEPEQVFTQGCMVRVRSTGIKGEIRAQARGGVDKYHVIYFKGGGGTHCASDLELVHDCEIEPGEKPEQKHSQYKRVVRLPLVNPIGEIKHVEVLMDVYDFLYAFKTGNPAIDHLVKKVVRAGTDHNDRITDLRESMDSLQRAIELEEGK